MLHLNPEFIPSMVYEYLFLRIYYLWWGNWWNIMQKWILSVLSFLFEAFTYLNTAESLLRSSEYKHKLINQFEVSILYSLKGEVRQLCLAVAIWILTTSLNTVKPTRISHSLQLLCQKYSVASVIILWYSLSSCRSAWPIITEILPLPLLMISKSLPTFRFIREMALKLFTISLLICQVWHISWSCWIFTRLPDIIMPYPLATFLSSLPHLWGTCENRGDG